MTLRPAAIPALIFAGLLLLQPSPAKADAIDGNWCHEGKRLKIDGPDLLTPGGKRMQGLYDRHGFEYKAPAGDMQAGKTITMSLVDDDTVHLTWTGNSQFEEWRRCRAPTS